MIIGKPIPRVEGVGKVNGAAAYTADVAPPDDSVGEERP